MAKTISTLDMTREDWLLARKRGIGASEIGAVLGLNKYRTAYDVWLDKTTPEVVEVQETVAMTRGKVLEEYIANRYANETGKKLRRDNKYRFADNLPLFCSLDRTIVGGGILEIKSVAGYALKHWQDALPLYYYAQLQQQLLITGQEHGEVAVLAYDDKAVETALFNAENLEQVFEQIVENGTLIIHPFEANPEFQENMVESAVKFWKCVEDKTPPPMTAIDYDKLMATMDDVVEADDSVVKVLEDLTVAQSRMKEQEEIADALKEKVKEAIGAKTILTRSGKVLATYKTITKKEYTVAAKSYRQLTIKK